MSSKLMSATMLAKNKHPHLAKIQFIALQDGFPTINETKLGTGRKRASKRAEFILSFGFQLLPLVG